MDNLAIIFSLSLYISTYMYGPRGLGFGWPAFPHGRTSVFGRSVWLETSSPGGSRSIWQKNGSFPSCLGGCCGVFCSFLVLFCWFVRFCWIALPLERKPIFSCFAASESLTVSYFFWHRLRGASFGCFYVLLIALEGSGGSPFTYFELPFRYGWVGLF